MRAGWVCAFACVLGSAWAAEPVGYLDGQRGDTLVGWSVDPDTPAANVEVHVYVDGPAGQGRLLGSVRADQPRPDINATLGYPGNHGFTFALPGSLRDGRAHRYYTYALDTSGVGANPQLTGSPQSVHLGGTTAQASSRGLAWVKSNPMFLSGLTVSMGPPTQAGADAYFNDFGANAVHLWEDGLPFEMEGWRRTRQGVRWLCWVNKDGLSNTTNTFLGGLPANAPGRIGYQIGDEPRSMAALQVIANTVPVVRAHDPNALIVLNFTYHAPDIDQQLAHVAQNVDADVISYDHYSRDSSGVYAELERFRAAGLRKGVPYWRYLYSYEDSEGLPTESDMRWNAFSGLVYGYTGHSWFLYQIGQAHAAGTGLAPALFTTPGSFNATRRPQYALAAQINREMTHLGRAITQLTSTGVCYEIGRWSFIRRWHVPGTRGWRRGAGGDPYLSDVDKNGRDLSLGFFTDDRGEHYVMIQNPSRTHGRQRAKGDRARTYELDFDFAGAPQGFDRSSVLVLNKSTGQVESLALQPRGANGARLVVSLAAGDPLLFKYKTGQGFALGR